VEEKELKKSWTQRRTHGHSGDLILCLMLCIALERQLNTYNHAAAQIQAVNILKQKVTCQGTIEVERSTYFCV